MCVYIYIQINMYLHVSEKRVACTALEVLLDNSHVSVPPLRLQTLIESDTRAVLVVTESGVPLVDSTLC